LCSQPAPTTTDESSATPTASFRFIMRLEHGATPHQIMVVALWRSVTPIMKVTVWRIRRQPALCSRVRSAAVLIDGMIRGRYAVLPAIHHSQNDW
jgi:hypothetical protein